MVKIKFTFDGDLSFNWGTVAKQACAQGWANKNKADFFLKKWAERCLFLFIFGFFNQILQQINVKHVQIVSVSWIISHGLLLMSLLQLPIDQDSVNKADFLFCMQ